MLYMLQMFYGNLSELVQFGNKITDECNFLSMVGIIASAPEWYVILRRVTDFALLDPRIDHSNPYGTIPNVPLHIPDQDLHSKVESTS